MYIYIIIAIKLQIIVLKFANIRNFSYLCSRMIVTFEQTYLQELYTKGKASDKNHRFQPQIVAKYVKVINLMKQQEEAGKQIATICNITELSNHYK